MAEVTMASAATASLLLRENRTYPRANPTSDEPTTDASTDYLWWSSEDVEDEFASPAMRLDGSEGGLWNGAFVPPPPRPIFLDEGVTPDGLTTCDLCSWAWQGQGHRPYQHVDKATEAPGELGWVLTLIIVSIISAAIGAVIMITALHCKSRMKNGSPSDSSQRTTRQSTSPRNRPPMSPPSDLSVDKSPTPEHFHATRAIPHQPTSRESATTGVWSWLTARRPLDRTSTLTTSTLPAENHYTHMDENYSSVGEALYAELDRDSNSPAYQNSAYTDPDAPTSSAPSSAYYSDLSVTTMPDRAYEVVGLNTAGGNNWDGALSPGDIALRKQPSSRLAAISETVSNMPSDYV